MFCPIILIHRSSKNAQISKKKKDGIYQTGEIFPICEKGPL